MDAFGAQPQRHACSAQVRRTGDRAQERDASVLLDTRRADDLSVDLRNAEHAHFWRHICRRKVDASEEFADGVEIVSRGRP